MSKKLLLCALTVLALPLAASATEYQTVERPRQQCWNEQVPVQTAGSDLGGAIIGGLAGGILGNQVGRGNGRTVATAVDAMTGAVVGDRMSNSGPGYQTVQRCRTVVDLVRVPVMPPPAPVYMQPEPVYVEPAPVIEQRVYYVGGEERRRDMEHRDWHEHREWREHHHHHDDDD